MPANLQGAEFEQWLFDPKHKTLPDFLDMPEVAFGNKLQKGDIHALRVLVGGRGEVLPTWCLGSIVRLYAHGIIDRRVEETGATYFITRYSLEVLKHNVSFRQGVRYDEPR